MNQRTMESKHNFFGWLTTGVGWVLSAAAIQEWFIRWNPVLQGVLFIVTILSTLIFIAKNKPENK